MAKKVTTETNPKYLRVGQEFKGEGGIFAGVVRGRDGGPDYYLIVGPELSKDGQDWNEAMAAAKKVKADGKNDFSLPYRNEQSIMFGNVPELFEKRWYWSCEQHAGDSDYAWLQDFDYGDQINSLKGNTRRARAVRRLFI
jgi:hypothetical protein